ncbi:MAG: cell division protein FtsA [Chloroflexi bacterium]|nr:cell division protein FtsA [Chloroflexota bacterium]
MAGERIIVGIDVGTTKVCTLIGELNDEDQLEIIGVGVSPSRGLRKGVVVNPDETVDSIRASLLKAEQQSGCKVVSAYVGIAGAHITSINSHGVVAVRRHDNLITAEDVNRALEAARVVTLPADREVIHVLPRHYVVDGQEGIKNPDGMVGHRLEVYTTIVAGAMTSIQNLQRCIERVEVGVDGLVLQPLAAGEAVLTEAEKDLGVVLLDIGGGTTDAAVFTEGSMAHALVLPVGGNHISNDIAVGLRTPFAAAEEIKIRHGFAIAGLVEDDRTIDVASFDKGEGRPVSRRVLSEIVEARLAEMFELVGEQLKRAGIEGGMPAGVVLAGGTAQLQGIKRLASDIFDAPVRIGLPNGVYGLVDAISNPAYATSVGLLKWGLTQWDEPSGAHMPGPLSGTLSALGNWLRSFFP